MYRIGVLTSGGDSPGMNAAVVAVARNAALFGMTLVGIRRGYNGLLIKNSVKKDYLTEMTLDEVLDIADLPGTYLRTARCEEFKDPLYQMAAVQMLREEGIEGLVIIGGDGSFTGAMKLCELGIHCIGIPGTIDNDLPYTEMTLGYDTAVNVCVNAIRSIRATSRSHDRAHIVEVMGRKCGDIAMSAAVSTGSEIVIVPEVPWSIEDVADRLRMLIDSGNTRATIVVAEGGYESMMPFNLHDFLAKHKEPCLENQKMTSLHIGHVLRLMVPQSDIRSTRLGYIQRGDSPSARDSTFAFEAGHMAVQLLSENKHNLVIGRKKGQVFNMPIGEALQAKREFNIDMYHLVNRLSLK